MDALIVIVAVFVLAAAFLVYQRHQYSILLQENADLAWENSSLEANLVLMTSRIDECKSFVASMQQSGAKGEPSDSLD
jgi:hypothetical protein